MVLDCFCFDFKVALLDTPPFEVWKKQMARKSTTVEQVREAQEFFKSGMNCHETKSYKEAIEAFTRCVSINPYDTGHLDELKKKLIQGSFKLVQESIAYMGCAAVHLNKMAGELDGSAKDQVPIDEALQKVFQGWSNG